MNSSYKNRAKARNVLKFISNFVYYSFISLITLVTFILFLPIHIIYSLGGVVETIFKDETDIEKLETIEKDKKHFRYNTTLNERHEHEHNKYVMNKTPYYDGFMWSIPLQLPVLLGFIIFKVIPFTTFNLQHNVIILYIMIYIIGGNIISYHFVKYYLKIFKLI